MEPVKEQIELRFSSLAGDAAPLALEKCSGRLGFALGAHMFQGPKLQGVFALDDGVSVPLDLRDVDVAAMCIRMLRRGCFHTAPRTVERPEPKPCVITIS